MRNLITTTILLCCACANPGPELLMHTSDAATCFAPDGLYYPTYEHESGDDCADAWTRTLDLTPRTVHDANCELASQLNATGCGVLMTLDCDVTDPSTGAHVITQSLEWQLHRAGNGYRGKLLIDSNADSGDACHGVYSATLMPIGRQPDLEGPSGAVEQ